MEDQSKWTRIRTRRTEDGLEAVKIYDWTEACYSKPVTNFPRKELLEKMGRSEK
jgi:hypothetical protein